MRVLLFNKPYGVVTQFSGEGPTLKDFIEVPGVYPIGRLDKDSEGLLLLTDDGSLSHRLTDPRYEHPKTYLVQVEGIPSEEALKNLRSGVEIQGYRTLPAEVELLSEPPSLPERPVPIRYRKSIPTSWLKIVLREGKNRQIRRMTAAVGFPTLRLYRVALGPINIGELPAGQWRELKSEELKAIQALGKQPSARRGRGDAHTWRPSKRLR